MNHHVTLCCLAAALLAGTAATAHAGEDEVPRRTFRESRTYPFIFRPEGYLASGGPVPMRIEQGPPPFSKRLAPPLPAAAKATEKPALPPLLPMDVHEPANKSGKGGKKEELPLPEPDLGKVPDEVLGFFREKEANPNKRLYLFDPIFQPARPNELPRSKATYTQKP
jgi:hypothetical protein